MTEIHAFDPDGTPSPGATTGVGTIVADAVSTDSAARAALDKSYRRGVSATEYGATGDGTTDDTEAIRQSLLAAAAESTTLHLAQGTYRITEAITLTGFGGSVDIVGEPGAVLDMTAVSSYDGIVVEGSVGATTPLLADAAKGAMSISATLPVAPAKGDLLRITSTDVWDASEQEETGEIVEVDSVSGNTITLVSPLFDGYRLGPTSVQAMTAPRVTLRDLTIIRDSNHCAVRVQYARDVLLSGLRVSGARESLLRVSNAHGVVIENCSGRDFYYEGTGTSYGVVIDSSQHVTHIANRIQGGRHALAHGGTFPCRDITILGGTYDSLHTTNGSWAVDFHANCEGVRIIGATILNGVGIFCPNVSVESSTIRAGGPFFGIRYSSSRDSEYFRVVDCDITAERDAICMLHSTEMAAYTVDLVEVTGGSLRSTTECGMRLAIGTGISPVAVPRFLRVRVDTDIRSGNDGILLVGSPTGHQIEVDRLEVSGSVRAGAHGVHLGQSAAIADVSIADAHLQVSAPASSPVMAPVGGLSQNVHVGSSVLTGSPAHYRSDFRGVGERLTLSDVTIRGASSAGGVIASGIPEAMVSRLHTGGSAGTPALPVRTLYEMSATGNGVGTAGGPPASGTWSRGDRLYRSSPYAGGEEGWVCVTSGTPGEWKAFGSVAS